MLLICLFYPDIILLCTRSQELRVKYTLHLCSLISCGKFSQMASCQKKKKNYKVGFESFCKGLCIAPYKTEVVRRLTISVFYRAIIIPLRNTFEPHLVHSFFLWRLAYRKNSPHAINHRLVSRQIKKSTSDTFFSIFYICAVFLLPLSHNF
jgi:hypothetical protein